MAEPDIAVAEVALRGCFCATEMDGVERALRRLGAVQALLALAPLTARVRRAGAEVEIPLVQVTVGDQVVVRPGDRVPVDGTVHNGKSYVDESLITGEPLPVAKSSGSQVSRGTVNTTGSFTFIASPTCLGGS
jgi:P-type E1-E2 ATPase